MIWHLDIFLFCDTFLLSWRTGNLLNTFLTSFTSSGIESQPKWTDIHSIHVQNWFSWGRTHFQKSNFLKVGC